MQTLDGQTENMQVDLSEALAQDGQFIITNEDGNVFPVAVSGMITLPVTAQMYHSLVQQQIPSSDNTVCVTPMQVQNLIANNSLLCSSNSISNLNPTTYIMSTANSNRNIVSLPTVNCQVKSIETTVKTRVIKKSLMKKKIFSMTMPKSKPKNSSNKLISKTCTDNNNCKDIKDKNDRSENFKRKSEKSFKVKAASGKQLDEIIIKKQNASEKKHE